MVRIVSTTADEVLCLNDLSFVFESINNFEKNAYEEVNEK